MTLSCNAKDQEINGRLRATSLLLITSIG